MNDFDLIKARADACDSTMGDVLDLIGQVEVLRELTQTCTCYDGNPENYEGLHADCPIHGAIRAFNEISRQYASLREAAKLMHDRFDEAVIREYHGAYNHGGEHSDCSDEVCVEDRKVFYGLGQLLKVAAVTE